MRTITLAAIGLSALALTACSTGVTPTAAPQDTASASGSADAGAGIYLTDIPRPEACESDSPFIAVSLPNLTNPYYVFMKKGFEEAGAEAGLKVEVQVADNDDAAQLAQVQAMLQRQPCALALNPVKSAPAAAIAKAANDAGVPVFTVNVTVDEEAMLSQGAKIVQYLGADNVAGGRQSAELALEHMGADAEMKIGFVSEPDEIPVVLRDQGFRDGIASNPNAEVVATVDGNVKPDDSLKVTQEMLQGNPDINVIFASTGPASYGAIQAVMGSGRDVKVYGFCAEGEATTDVYPGCVAQEPQLYGQLVIEEITAWLGGETPEQEILQPLKVFSNGEKPADNELG
ncbi:ribose ABC transporter ATP-binding protein [Tessaracoccus lapidicaptus]|uniref:Ribose ABC transporter ATP-binding protein n=1 Tax=Tessaracoccus lapidicaptus TaxID=1427523 RepID=A0A1C0AGR2_9ACTN|nr:substrate-binding domain-containing protein [Tessaracoccus lapidicaptus]OCL30915.1 ribose ABC transporter ATP-binding protein [Tessaracoccus lapidicaptus]